MQRKNNSHKSMYPLNNGVGKQLNVKSKTVTNE